MEIGKLCLAAIFQLPCTSRTKPSTIYKPQYYNVVFSRDQVVQKQVAKLCKELLYIDYYFRTEFQKKYDHEYATMPDANIRISFAHNARTVCIAFVAFAARYHQGNITNQDLQLIFSTQRSEVTFSSDIYDIFSRMDGVQYLIPPVIFAQKDEYELLLDHLFTTIINAGIMSFSVASRYDSSLTASNYLKNDKRYYEILSDHWANIHNDIQRILSSIMK